MRQFKKALIKKIKGQHKPFIVFGGIYTVLLSLIYIFKVSPTTPAALLLLWTAFYGIPLIVIYMLLYLYLKALEQSCLIKLVSPSQLTEGDWLEKDILVKGHLIKKSVHGLSSKEIEILRKAKKSVWIRYGVPFVPAFLLALLTMGYVFFVAQLDAQQILSWLL